MRRAPLYHVCATGFTAFTVAADAVAATARIDGVENDNVHMYNIQVLCGTETAKSTSLSPYRRQCCTGGRHHPLMRIRHVG